MVTKTSARVSGCFTSTQPEILVHYYADCNDPILTDESFLNTKLSIDRKAIVFTDNVDFWASKLKNERSDITKTIAVLPVIDFYNISFTGFEALSVVIYVDKLLATKYDDEMLVTLNLAITRAQYEVMVLVRHDLKKRVKEFFRPPTRLELLFVTLSCI